MRLVYHMYGKIGDGPIKENYKEDIISEGMLGLCKAAHTFDESRGVRFSTYAAMCIRNAMLMFIRKTKKHFQREVSLYETVGRDADGKELTLADIIEDESQSEDEIITRIMLEDFEEKQASIDKKIINELNEKLFLHIALTLVLVYPLPCPSDAPFHPQIPLMPLFTPLPP